MKKIRIICTLLLGVSGCNSEFTRTDYVDPSKNRKITLEEINHSIKDYFTDIEREDENKVLINKVLAKCEYDPLPPPPLPSAKAIDTVTAAVIGTSLKLFWDLSNDESVKSLKRLKKASQGSYSSTMTISAGEFKDINCLAIVRQNKEYVDGKRDISLAAIVKLDHIKEKYKEKVVGNENIEVVKDIKIGVKFSPLYIRAKDSVALTLKKGVEKPWINTTIALAIKTIGMNKHKLPELVATGAGTVDVSELVINTHDESGKEHKEESKEFTNSESPESDLIPYPINDNKILSVTLSVTESGNLGFDLDDETARITAIKDALGPLIVTLVDSEIEEDE